MIYLIKQKRAAQVVELRRKVLAEKKSVEDSVVIQEKADAHRKV